MVDPTFWVVFSADIVKRTAAGSPVFLFMYVSIQMNLCSETKGASMIVSYNLRLNLNATHDIQRMKNISMG